MPNQEKEKIEDICATGAPFPPAGEGKGMGAVLLTHPGTQYAPRLAAALHQQGVLQCFATGIAFSDSPGAWWWKLAKMLGQEKRILKRVIPGLPAGKLHLQPIKEALALLRHQALGHHNDAVFFPRNRAFQQALPQKLIEQADVVIGFDTSSWILAERCKKAGKPFVLDASIAHPLAKEKVFAALREKYPAWAAELAPKDPRLIEVELKEIELADHIVAASSFTKKTYTDHGVPAEKITVNPYGTDLKSVGSRQSAIGNSDARQLQTANCKLQTANCQLHSFLFFGSLSARKGFPWLCEVWKDFHQRFPGCRLIAAGYDNRPPGFSVPPGVEVIGPVHPNDRAALFASADVFVFPSMFEGFGQVILEAMACGLPVITTTATGGPDLLAGHPNAGILIEPGNDAALLQALEYFAGHPEKIKNMGDEAQKAAAPFTWDAYGQRWEDVLNSLQLAVSSTSRSLDNFNG